MIKSLWTNLRFELTSRKRMISPYLYWAVVTTLVFLMVLATGGAFKGMDVNFGLGQKVLINSPYSINLYYALISLFGILIVSPIFGQAVCKDYEAKFDQIVLATPAQRTGFYLGRYFGALIVCSLIFTGLALGHFLASALPLVQRSLFGPHRLDAYLVPFVSIVIPNILIFGSIAFAMGAVTKKMSAVYVTGILCFMGYLFGQGLTSDIDKKLIRGLVDPFGMQAISGLTEYWSVADMNSRLVSLSGILLWNRLLWIGVSLAFLAIALTFVQRAPKPKKVKKDMEAKAAGIQAAPVQPALISSSPLDFSPKARLRLLFSQAWFEAKGALKNIYFVCLTLAGVIYMFLLNGQIGGKIFGTATYPTTYKVLEISSGSFSLFLLIIMTFYTGELIWRERQSRLNQIVDAMPTPIWLSSISKFLAMQVIIASLLVIVGLCGVIIQMAHGYTRFELGQVFTTLYSLEYVSFLIMSALIFALHTIIDNKYIGHGLVVLYLIISGILSSAGFDHILYRYNSGTDSPPYSDMNGYGPYLLKIRNLQLYWGLAAAILLCLVYLFWVRGTDSAWERRLLDVKRRFTTKVRVLVLVLVLAFAAQAGHIFYNTNVLNHYQTAKQSELDAVYYEQTYKAKYDGVAQLKIGKVNAAVDIFPSKLWMKAKVNYVFENKSGVPVNEFFVTLPVKKKYTTLTIDRPAELAVNDERIDINIYRFATPVAPGEKVNVTYTVDYGSEGFKNSGTMTSIAGNGTFFNNQTFFPGFGYNDGGELSSDKKREQYGFQPKPRMPPITDEKAKQVTYVTGLDADWIDFETTVSTDKGQIAIAPGYLQKEWEDGDRHYFQYAMDSKILNFYSYLSAHYEVKRDKWNDVNIEVYYQKGHEYNIESMIEATKQGLAYYTENFGPYQHRQFRILEFPRYSTFAQSFPNTIPFSESIGFIAKVDPKDEEDLDYPYYVTAHELAHQWWAHQVIGANVQGATVLSETLSQYSALMVMEKRFGRDKMARFLQHEMNDYLRSRSGETKKEQPLFLNENQQYIHYNKGSVVMYALKEVVGEKELNAAIKKYADKVHYQEAPFTTATEFVASLKESLDPKFHPVIDDLMTKITLYDNRIEKNAIKKEEDGTYTVDLDILGKKVYVDDKGDENDSTMDQTFEVTARDAEKKIIFTERYPLKTGQNHLTIKLPSQPKTLWLDELGVWIDKNRDDNKVTF